MKYFYSDILRRGKKPKLFYLNTAANQILFFPQEFAFTARTVLAISETLSSSLESLFGTQTANYGA